MNLNDYKPEEVIQVFNSIRFRVKLVFYTFYTVNIILEIILYLINFIRKKIMILVSKLVKREITRNLDAVIKESVIKSKQNDDEIKINTIDKPIPDFRPRGVSIKIKESKSNITCIKCGTIVKIIDGITICPNCDK